LHAPRKPPIIVQIRTGVRENPLIKTTAWAEKRALYFTEELEEVVLKDENNCLYEGLSSNFGILMKGTIFTAPHGSVLPGVTLELILHTCRQLNIKVVEQFPSLDTIHQWEGAFISSTSRGLMPVDIVRIYGTMDEIVLPKPQLWQTLSNQLYQETLKTASFIERL